MWSFMVWCASEADWEGWGRNNWRRGCNAIHLNLLSDISEAAGAAQGSLHQAVTWFDPPDFWLYRLWNASNHIHCLVDDLGVFFETSTSGNGNLNSEPS